MIQAIREQLQRIEGLLHELDHIQQRQRRYHSVDDSGNAELAARRAEAQRMLAQLGAGAEDKGYAIPCPDRGRPQKTPGKTQIGCGR